ILYSIIYYYISYHPLFYYKLVRIYLYLIISTMKYISPMAILLIENYYTPADIISKYTYRKSCTKILVRKNNYILEDKIYSKKELYAFLSKDNIRYTSKIFSMCIEDVDDDTKYYFSEICSVKSNSLENEIITIYNKNKDRIKYYEIIRNQRDRILNIRKIEDDVVEKKENEIVERNLPFYDAQQGEIVVFPSDEEDE
ncbi:hypothetical protein SLOPH_1051, partial [Spraguea lophii 42_110]